MSFIRERELNTCVAFSFLSIKVLQVDKNLTNSD